MNLKPWISNADGEHGRNIREQLQTNKIDEKKLGGGEIHQTYMVVGGKF